MPVFRGMKSTLLALMAILFAGGFAMASPSAKVYQVKDPGWVTLGGLKAGMSKEQAIAVLGTPVKSMGQSLYYDQDKKGVSIATFQNDKLLQVFGIQVELKGKPAKTREQMEKLLGPPSLQPDPKSAYWYIEAPNARLIVVFSSENGKPYCSLIDRTGKDF